MAAIDFDKQYSEFLESGEGSSIQDLYTVIPALTDSEMMILHQIKFYADKYELPELHLYIQKFVLDKNKNKNLNFVRSMNFKTLVKAKTMEDILNIKVNAMRKSDD